MTKTLISAALLLALLLVSSPPDAAGQLARVEEAIRETGAKWTAGEISISVLSSGGKLSPGTREPRFSGTERLLAEPGQAARDALPRTFDWRNAGGNFVTPVKSQLRPGSSWAFGITAALESSVLIARGTEGFNLDLSEQALLSCSGTGDLEEGGDYGKASDFIRDTGLPPEKCYPSVAVGGSCAKACPGWEACAARVSGWTYVTDGSPTVDAIKTALVKYGPLPAIFSVYSDFFSYKTGIYSYTTGDFEANHVVLIVGYDERTQSFTAKNSWGTGWGESGYFRIAYSEVADTRVKFGRFAIAVIPPERLTVLMEGDGSGVVRSACLTCSKGECVDSYASGADVVLIAEPSKNAVFRGWSGCTVASGNVCRATMTNDVAVSATFLKGPKISMTPASLDFGGIKAGSTSEVRRVTIKNGGSANLLIGSFILTGGDSVDFHVSAACGGPIKGGGQCADVGVRFSPTGKGPKKAMMVIQSNDAAVPSMKVALRGKGK